MLHVKAQRNDILLEEYFTKATYYYLDEPNSDSAIIYYTKSLPLLKEENGDTSELYLMVNKTIGDLYLDTGDDFNAIKYYSNILKIYQKKNETLNVDYANLLFRIGTIYSENNNQDLAIKYYKQTANVIFNTKGENDLDYAAILKRIGNLYYKEYNYKESVEYYKKTLLIYQKTLGYKDEETIKIINKIGLAYQELSEFNLAKDYLFLVEQVVNEHYGDVSELSGHSKNNISVFYSTTGYMDSAIYYSNKATEIRYSVCGKSSNEYALSLNNLGNCYINKGEYKIALEIIEKSYEIYEDNGEANEDEKISVLINLGYTNYSIFNSQKALNYYYLALNLTEKYHDEINKSLVYNNIGVLYSKQGIYDSSNFYLKASLKTRQKLFGDINPTIGENLNNIGMNYLDLLNYVESKECFIKALKIYSNYYGEDSQDYLTVLTNLATVYLNLGKADSATYMLQKVVEKRIKIFGQFSQEVTSSKELLSFCYWKQNNLDQTTKIFSDVLNVKRKLISNNFEWYTYNQKCKYWASEELFFSAIPTLVTANNNKGNDDFCYNSILLFKSILLEDSKYLMSSIKRSNDVEVIKTFKKLKDKKQNILAQSSNSNLDRQKLQLYCDSLEDIIIRKLNNYSGFKKKFEILCKDVKLSLHQNEAAIEFSKYYDAKDSSFKYMAQVLRSNYEYPYIVKLCSEKEIEKYKAGNGLSELYRLVWEPIDSLLVGVKTVYYSPDGLLYSVPFNALCTNDTAGCSYLMDEYTLHQLSTTRYLADSTLINTKPLNNTIALYGGINYEIVNDTNSTNNEESNEDFILANNLKRETTFSAVSYLPGTKQEVESVVPLFNKNKWTTTIATGSKASEQLFKSYSDTLAPSIIHIATHGFAFPDKEDSKKKNRMDMLMLSNNQQQYTASEDPMMRCGLMFAGANKSWTGKQKEMIEQTGQDGILTAAEVANMDLSNTKLVVLSACETGLGKVEGSEGVFGLQRGFKLAGVEQLIVSLWKVPDRETMELMNLFYTDLTITKDPVISFSTAQKQMRNNYPDNPEKWAGFVLVR
jgi:CHAT domain-containing protein/tetratricopeptide (TPR) repeat protein